MEKVNSKLENIIYDSITFNFRWWLEDFCFEETAQAVEVLIKTRFKRAEPATLRRIRNFLAFALEYQLVKSQAELLNLINRMAYERSFIEPDKI